MPPLPRPLYAGLVVILVIGGCSAQPSGDEPARSSTATTPQTSARTAAALPDCAGAGSPVGRRSGLPDTFPLPDGTVLTSSEVRSGGRTVIEGHVPDGFDKTLEFFQRKLPESGFEPGEGEVEPERKDAESNFEGRGYLGRWKVSSIPGCENVTGLSLLIQHE